MIFKQKTTNKTENPLSPQGCVILQLPNEYTTTSMRLTPSPCLMWIPLVVQNLTSAMFKKSSKIHKMQIDYTNAIEKQCAHLHKFALL